MHLYNMRCKCARQQGFTRGTHTHAWSIIARLHAGTAPITITIYDPLERRHVPDVYLKTFENAQRFDMFMDRGSIATLFKDGASPAISAFEDLVPGAMYTPTMCTIPARAITWSRTNSST